MVVSQFGLPIYETTWEEDPEFHDETDPEPLATAGELEQALAVLEGAWINGFRYDRVFKYDPYLRVLKEWSRFEEWKTGHGINWDRYRRATRFQ